MKPFAIISFIVLSSIGIGFIQQSQLAGLKRESTELSRCDTHSSSEKLTRHPRLRPQNSLAVARISSDESLAEVETLMVSVFQELTDARQGYSMADAETAEQKILLDRLFKSFSTLDAAAIIDMVRRLKSNPSAPQVLRDQAAQACVEILMEVNPQILLEVIPCLGNYPRADAALSDAFQRSLSRNPVAALKWYDEETEKRRTLTSSFLYSIIVEESKLDPSHALSRALANEELDHPEDLKNLGANIAWKLEEVSENLTFFSALRRENEKFPDSALLADIRRAYVGELARHLYQWSFESALPLINSGFTPTEKATIAKELCRGDFDDPEKWATWMSKIPTSADGKHPVEEFFGSWFHSGPAAAGKWLQQVPPGELKDKLTKEMAEN